MCGKLSRLKASYGIALQPQAKLKFIGDRVESQLSRITRASDGK